MNGNAPRLVNPAAELREAAQRLQTLERGLDEPKHKKPIDSVQAVVAEMNNSTGEADRTRLAALPSSASYSTIPLSL
jgi:hypothetical protein